MSTATEMDNVPAPLEPREPVTEAVWEQAAGDLADGLRRGSVVLPRAELEQNLSLAQGLGMFQAFDLMTQFTGMARAKWLAERRQSGDYKGATVAGRDGRPRKLTSFEDLCDYLGMSRSQAYEDLKNLSLLGESFMATAESLGLGYRDLRMLRRDIASLPEADREAVLREMAEGPEDLREKLADMKAELLRTKASMAELEQTAQARERVLSARAQKLDELEQQVERLTAITPDRRDQLRAAAEVTARGMLDARCNDLFRVVTALAGQCAAILADDRLEDPGDWMEQKVSAALDAAAEIILGTGLEVDLRARFEPIVVAPAVADGDGEAD